MLANNAPADALDTNPQPCCGPNRFSAALAAIPTASTASPNRLPVGKIRPNNGSMSWANTVNQTRTASAWAANRRSQPRTVEAGTPWRASGFRGGGWR